MARYSTAKAVSLPSAATTRQFWEKLEVQPPIHDDSAWEEEKAGVRVVVLSPGGFGQVANTCFALSGSTSCAVRAVVLPRREEAA